MNKKKLSFIVAILMIGFLVFGLTIMKIYNDYKKYHDYYEFEGVVTSVDSDTTTVGAKCENSDDEDCELLSYSISRSVVHKVGDEISIYVSDNCDFYNGGCSAISSKFLIGFKDFIYFAISYLLINYGVISLACVFNEQRKEQNDILEKLDKKISKFSSAKKFDNSSKK